MRGLSILQRREGGELGSSSTTLPQFHESVSVEVRYKIIIHHRSIDKSYQERLSIMESERNSKLLKHYLETIHIVKTLLYFDKE